MTSKGSTPNSGLPAELQGLLAAERDPPRIAEPERAALIARLVAASEKNADDRAAPWWSGIRLRPLSVAFGVAVFGGGVVWASQSGYLWPSEPASAATSAVAAPPKAATKTPTLSAVPEPSAAPPTSAAQATADAPASSAPALPPSASGAKRTTVEVGDELSALEMARAAQQRGDHAEALRSIAAHERRYPRSIFVEEREALRVSALGKLGRTTEARARARAFVDRYPRSVFVSKLAPWLSD